MEDNRSFLELQVDQQVADNLSEASRWAKLLAVIGLIGMGLLFFVLLFLRNKIAEQFLTKDEMSNESGIVGFALLAGFLFFAAIVGVLLNFLIRGANQIRQGINSRDQYLFNRGLSNLGNYFTMYGILGILGLVFSLLAFINR